MAEIVNLRRTRKAKAREAAEAEAAANRAKFGRSKAEKKLRTAEEARDEKLAAQHRLEPRDRKP